MRALIVDDSRAARSFICRAAQSLGFATVEAEHGAAALELIARIDRVDVMLVDWNMPVMDGLELVKQVRKIREYAAIPILMISSESDPKMMARALIAGTDDYLMKPIDADVLGARLEILGVQATSQT